MKKIYISLVLALIFIPFSAHAQTNEQPLIPKPKPRLIKSTDSDAVYYLDSDLKRHAFPNEKIFFSWYNDFSEVELVMPGQLADYQLSNNILYRPGSVLFKTPSVNEVYVVGPWGEIYNLESEQVASALYGPNWAMKVHDLDVSFFFDYSIRDVIRFNEENLVHYPPGSLVRHLGMTYVVDYSENSGRLLRPISGNAWFENNFDSLPVHEFDLVENSNIIDFGLPVYTYEAKLGCTSCAPQDLQTQEIHLGEFSTNDDLLSFYAPNYWLENLSLEAESSQAAGVVANLSNENQTVQFKIYKQLAEFFTDMQDFADQMSDTDHNVFSGASLIYPEAWDFVEIYETGGGDFVVWTQAREYEDFFYFF